MNKVKAFFRKPKIIYKTFMCICICVLCFLTVLITDSGQENTSATNEETVGAEPENVIVDEEKINEITEGLSKEESVEDATEESEPEPQIAEPSFSTPIYGMVQKPFSPQKVLYSKTMDDWRIHLGVDVKASIGTDVNAAEGGTVTYSGYDINLGYTVKIQSGEYECIYSSLDSKIPVNVNDTVTKGQIIGTLSDSCISEICDDPHLHFEMKKNDQYVNPEEYVSFS